MFRFSGHLVFLHLASVAAFVSQMHAHMIPSVLSMRGEIPFLRVCIWGSDVYISYRMLHLIDTMTCFHRLRSLAQMNMASTLPFASWIILLPVTEGEMSETVEKKKKKRKNSQKQRQRHVISSRNQHVFLGHFTPVSRETVLLKKKGVVLLGTRSLLMSRDGPGNWLRGYWID